MPNKKKKLFTKDNSVKFLLLHGNTEAVNADGKKLENVLVPVSNSYKPGTSLLMSNIAAFSNLEEAHENDEDADADLKKIMDAFDDSDSEIVIEDVSSKRKTINFPETSGRSGPSDVQNVYDKSYFFEDDGQFSDDLSSDEEDIIDNIEIDPNCPESLKMLNEKFEKILSEYKTDQIGPLDEDEDFYGLSASPTRVDELLDSEAKHEEEEPSLLEACYDEALKEKILHYAEDESEPKIVEIVKEKPIEFDCESILSTYSNVYNHPTVIKEERVKKIQVLNNPLRKKLTKSQLKTLDNEKESDNESDDNVSVSTAFNVRVKGETPEQKRERKNLFKEAKRESRILKKENKLAFKREKKIQTSQNINTQRNAGIRLL